MEDLGTGVITCKAAVAYGPKEELQIVEVEVGPPQPKEIRIQVVCTSLSRMDFNDWQTPPEGTNIFPRIFGHEAVGFVERVGNLVTEFQEGDCVLTMFTGQCNTCGACTSGRANIMCLQLPMMTEGVMHSDNGTRFSRNGQPIYHYCAVSSFSQYTVVNSGCAVKINEVADADLDKVCLLSGGVAAGLGASLLIRKEGSTVVIFGLGIVGLSVAQGASLGKRASQIIGVDIDSSKKEIAKHLGVTEFVNPNELRDGQHIHEIIHEKTGSGADYAFECVGDTGILTDALKSCCYGWGLTVILGFPTNKPEVTVHYGLFHAGVTLRGPIFGGLIPKTHIPGLVQGYLNKRIRLDPYITHNLKLNDINEAFRLMSNNEGLRCIIRMRDTEAL